MNKKFFLCLVLLLQLPTMIEAQERQTAQPQTTLPIFYVGVGDGKYSPAYVDNKARIIYVWRDVVLSFEQVPGATDVYRGPLPLPLEQYKDCTIKTGSPPVRYAVIDKKIQFGYFASGGFYRWRGLQLDESEIPKAFEPHKLNIEKIPILDIDIPKWAWNALFGGSPKDETPKGGGK